MANKRELKKQIKYVCGELAGECIVARDLIPGMDFDKMNDIIVMVAELQASSLDRVNFAFDKTKKEFSTAKEYNLAKGKYNSAAYSTLRSDFNKKVEEIVKAMNAQLSDEQKEANKQLAKA